MLQNQINEENEIARVYYNEEYLILVFCIRKYAIFSKYNQKIIVRRFWSKRRDSKAIQCNSKHTKQYKT